MSVRMTLTCNGFGQRHGAARYLASTQIPIKIAYFYQGGSLIALRAFYLRQGAGQAAAGSPALPRAQHPHRHLRALREALGARGRAEGAALRERPPAARRRPANGRAERPAPPARARGGRLHTPTWRAAHLLLPSHQSALRGRGAAALPSQ